MTTGLLTVAGAMSAARADTAPSPAGGQPATVTAEALPTVQVNGVVWAQATVGNTVYVTGQFTAARPPGAAAGASETPRANLLAYDITTGRLVTGFDHTLDAPGKALAVSPDKTRLYVGGAFTKVDGQSHGRLAAFDLTKAGALINGWTSTVDATVNALAVTDATVYAGGSFQNVLVKGGTVARQRLAAFAAATGTATGAVTAWAPSTSATVLTMLMSPDVGKVVVGGMFETLAGAKVYGLGAVDAVSGVAVPAWVSTRSASSMRPYGTNLGFDSLSTDGAGIYASAYSYNVKSPTGYGFEGTALLKPTNGAVVWANDCHGDTYGSYQTGGVNYTVGHAHDCSAIEGFPEQASGPGVTGWHRATATTTVTSGRKNLGPDSYSWNYADVEHATLLHWFPELTPGTFTGQSQAAWSITGNGTYLTLGGEFPKVNGAAQQGLVRFAIRPAGTNRQPQYSDNLNPKARVDGSTVTLRWSATWDMDSQNLTYVLKRDGVQIATFDAASRFWQMPRFVYVDRSVAPGNHTYRVGVKDAFGPGIGDGVDATVTVAAGTPPPAASTDLALGRPAWQSSLLANSAVAADGGNVADPDRAVDGNANGAFSAGSVTHTASELNPWWQTDLQASRPVTSVTVHNRTDCCADRLTDHWIFVSDQPFDTTLTPVQQAARPGVWSAHRTTAPNPAETVSLPSGSKGRYVMVQLAGTAFLHLAEVVVN